MKDYVLELASQQDTVREKFNLVREYLQAYILKIFMAEGFFRSAAFVGGTALRFLYSLPRYSEDLVFSFVYPSRLNFIALIQKTKEELLRSGYTVEVSANDEKTVNNAWAKFKGLLYEAGVSPLRSENLSVKIEIDTNPPQGAVLKNEVVTKFLPLSILSYDLPSLFSGKLGAVLSRKYTKGRDLFDLGWYLSKWRDIVPNIALLRNSLTQTGWTDTLPDENNWRDFVCKVVKRVNWNKIEQELNNFVERKSDIQTFSRDNILALLSRQ